MNINPQVNRKHPYRVLDDGREICSGTTAGKREYKDRRRQMWERDGGICCLCAQPIDLRSATFEHLGGRGIGGGKRDDRVSMNGVSHYFGNMAKGSMSYEKYMELSAWQRVMNCRGGM